MSSQIALKPRLSEKSYGLSQATNTYVFDVPLRANKLSVSKAISSQYSVTVNNVNIANSKGKSRRTFVNRRGKFVRGVNNDVKKAYVTLKKGDKLPIFAAEEEADAKSAKDAAKKSKKATK